MFQPSVVSSLNKLRAKLNPLDFCSIFRVLDLKPLKIERGVMRRKKGSLAVHL